MTKVTGEKNPSRMVSVWASYLSLASVPGLLSVLFSHGRLSLSFTEATRTGRACAWLLWAVGGLLERPACVAFTRHGERADDPTSATRRIQHAINQFTDLFFAEQVRVVHSLASPDPCIPLRLFEVNLRKVIGHLTYDLLLFVEFARYVNCRCGIANARLVILSPMAVLASATSSGWAGPDVSFIYQKSFRYSLALRFAQGIVSVLARLRLGRQPAISQPPAVAVVGQWGLDRDAQLNDLFWWWESGIDAGRVILFFDRPGPPTRDESLRSAKKLGIRCLALNRQGAGDCSELLWRGTLSLAKAGRLVKEYLRLLGWGAVRGQTGSWVAGQLSGMVTYASVFEEFLAQHNVRAVFHWNDIESDFISLACEAVSAARIGYQWSNIHWPVACQARLHQVYFPWGPLHSEILSRAGSCTPHVLYSGCIFQGASPIPRRTTGASAEREAVLASGAERVLALFDNSLPCENFYQFFLERVIQDPRWGLLIKPKGVASLPWSRGDFPALRSLYEQALATGRVRLLEPHISPARAAAAADLSIGVDINSATILAALAGHRAVHLDYVPLHESPLSQWAIFYQAGPDRLVFDNPDKLWASLNRFFDEPGSLPTLGLADKDLLSRIDPFRDGRAGHRIGEYVRWYLEGFEQGLDRDEALAEATRRYAEKWGSTMVCRGLPQSLGADGLQRENHGSSETVEVR